MHPLVVDAALTQCGEVLELLSDELRAQEAGNLLTSVQRLCRSCIEIMYENQMDNDTT